MKNRFIVEVMKSGKWKKHSDHRNYDYAEINALVQEKAGLKARIKQNGEVIYCAGQRSRGTQDPSRS